MAVDLIQRITLSQRQWGLGGGKERVAKIFFALDGVSDNHKVVPLMEVTPPVLRGLLAEASTCFVSRTLVQRWICAFLSADEVDASLVPLALEVIQGLDHPNTSGERPYPDPVHVDLVKKFVEKIEKAGLECPGLNELKLRCGLIGREPVPTNY